MAGNDGNHFDDPGTFSQPTYHQTFSESPTTGLPHPGSAQPGPGQGGVPRAGVPGRPGQSSPSSTAPLPVTRQPPTRPQVNGDVTVTRAVVARGTYFSRLLAHKVISASQADGARESGLTALIWNQVMSYGADAMITVALAGTVFFSAPSEQQRGNVFLYLLMTMAPFALVAPVIGPALDRFQHGRRWVMSATAVGRCLLAVVMAMNFNDLLVLFPAALGSLVLSKAYAVIRSSAAPRLVPTNLTLVEANARLSIFGLGAQILGGVFVGVTIKASGSYSFGLWLTAIAFMATAVFAIRLPKIVDTLPTDPALQDAIEHSALPRYSYRNSGHPLPPHGEPRPQFTPPGFGRRLLDWMRYGFDLPVILAMQGESTLRWLSGFLTLFLAFHVETVSHGWRAAASLGALGAATGIGNFLGTGIGTRLKLRRPDRIILLCTAIAAVACLIGASVFSLAIAIVVALTSAVSNSLGKLSLDSIIQRDVAESLRSSAFGRSETFLQLSWVFGAALGVLLPARDGGTGFIVATVVTASVTISLLIRSSSRRRSAQ